MFNRALVSLFAAVLIASCSAAGPKYKAVVIPNDSAVIYVYRPAQFANAGGYPSIYIDGQEIGYLKDGGYLVKVVSAGKHVVLSKGNPMIWLLPDTSIEVTTTAGAPTYIRLLSGAAPVATVGTNVYMERNSLLHNVEPLEAAAEIQEMNLSQ